MSNRKDLSEEAFGRIWKNTLAQTVDSVAGLRTKRDTSQRGLNHETTSRKSLNGKDSERDDLDAANIQAALQNMRSLSGCDHTSNGSFHTSHGDKETSSSSHSGIKNITVKIHNDKSPVSGSDQSHGRFSKHSREVREQTNNSRDQVHQGTVEKNISHSISGSKNLIKRGDKTHPRRNDLLNFKRKDESKELPPRFRSKKTDEGSGVDQMKHDQRTLDDNVQGEKVVVLDMKDENAPTSVVLKDKKELDAYDKWKLKRQNASSATFNKPRLHHADPSSMKTNVQVKPTMKTNVQVKPTGKAPQDLRYISLSVSEERIKSLTVCPSKDSELVKSIGGDIVSPSSDDETGPLNDSYDTVGSNKVMFEHAPKDQPLTVDDQNSAMDKIQSLYQTYTSPDAPRHDKKSKDYAQGSLCHADVSANAENEDDSSVTCVNSNSVVRHDGVICDSAQEEFESNSYPRGDKDKSSLVTDVRVTTRDDRHDLIQNVSTDIAELQLSDEGDGIEQSVRSVTNCLGNDKMLEKESCADDPCVVNKLKYPPNFQSLIKSPSSIPSGFSSDYEVGIISQSEAEEDEESPHPCAANLFPSSQSVNEKHHHHHQQQQQHQEQNMSSASAPSSQMPRYYGHQPPMSHNQMPFPMAPWFHPYYNHPDPFRPPYHPAPPQPSHYPGFMGMESFPGQQHTPAPPSQYNKATCKNKLVLPADKFDDEDSIKEVMDFVAAKKEEWDKFMTSRHGQPEPVEVVISVTLSGITPQTNDAASGLTQAQSAYAAAAQQSAWHYHNMYPNMAYNYNAYWQQPYTDEHGSYPMQNGSHAPRQVGKEEAVEENCDSDGEDMKRRALSFENEGCDNNGERQLTKKRMKNHDGDENRAHQNNDSEEESTQCLSGDKKSSRVVVRNSLSSFLNPNDLKNDWRSTSVPNKPSSSSSNATKQSKYDLVPGQQAAHGSSSKEQRDRSPHNRSSTSFQQSSSHKNAQDKEAALNDEDNDSYLRSSSSSSSTAAAPSSDLKSNVKTSYDQQSVCVVESNKEEKKHVEEKDYEPITGKWAEICPEPEPVPEENSFSSCSSPRDLYTPPQHRRRSDSVVSYDSDDRSPFARGHRSSRTPGTNKERLEDNKWKVALMARSRSYRHQFIDTHCHIDFMYHRFKLPTMPFKQYIERNSDSFPVNYGGCVAVFCNPRVFSEGNQAYSILKQLQRENNVWVAIGCHPKMATEFEIDHLTVLKQYLTTHPKVVALGEIGLDYSGSFHQHKAIQTKVFVAQLELAVELNIPLVIHCRDADDDCVEILKKHVPANHKIHLHCFTRRMATCRMYLDHFPNLFVGFTPLIMYRSARDATQSAAMVPLDRLLLETDAPYFVPIGVNAQFTHPGMALYTAERIAEIRNVSVDYVLEACRKNTRSMYGI